MVKWMVIQPDVQKGKAMLPIWASNACEEIDAGFFSSDTFHDKKGMAIADPARLQFFYFVVLGFSLLSSPLLLSLPNLRSGM